MIPLEMGHLVTVGDLIAVLETFSPEMKVLLNQTEKIASVDGRGDVLWLCDIAHSPLCKLLNMTKAEDETPADNPPLL